MRQRRPSHNAWPVLTGLLLFGCSNTHGSGLSTLGAVRDDSSPPNDGGTHGDAQATPVRVVTGPVVGGTGTPFTASAADLSAAGYTEKDFFLEGTAITYIRSGGSTPDGTWSLMETTSAPFKTRLLARRPIDPSRFNGTVVVEWFNVSGGADADPGFMTNADMILREGYAWVGVSAQVQGVQGGGASPGTPGVMPLTTYDPERYGSLYHPGDPYCFDIFSQAGQVLRDPEQVDVLEGLKPQRLIAYGQSQSAIALAAYVDGVHPLVKSYDGYFIHSRSGYLPAFDLKPFSGFGVDPAHIRDDIEAKVFQLQTETDVTGQFMFLGARQPDSDRLRTWEVAGASHADKYITDFNAQRAGQTGFACPGANDGPLSRVARAALSSLDLWLRDGTAPARGAVLSTDASGKPLQDKYGNTLGGVRSPDVDVPIRTLSGEPPVVSSSTPSNPYCTTFGSVTTFTADRLMNLYPTHADYVAKVNASGDALHDAGFLLAPEVAAFVADAEKAAVPN